MILIILIVIIVLALYVVSQYNKLITLRNNRENAFADIDVQLKQRFDLVPNLINTVKWYAAHEEKIYDKILEARKSFTGAWTTDEKIAASNMLSGALKWLFAIAESNPELKANENFIQLQNELSDIENKVAAARRFFNSATNEFNTYLETFPTNLIAKMFAFQRVTMFEVSSEEERIAPKVEF